MVELSWQAGAELAAGVGGVAIGLRALRHGWARPAAAIARELSIVCGLYAIWRLAGTLSVMKVNHALDRGLSIWRFERAVRLPSELAIQRAALGHPLLVEFCNRYYQVVHGPALAACLAFLFFRHRSAYPAARNVIAMVTGASLLLQLVPVAPPRLLPSLGFADTGQLYHQTVYTALGRGMADQLSAMPSVHVAWAVLIALIVTSASSSRVRVLIWLHPVLTVLAVVVTANHFWLDGVVGAALIVPALVIQRRLIATWEPWSVAGARLSVATSWADGSPASSQAEPSTPLSATTEVRSAS